MAALSRIRKSAVAACAACAAGAATLCQAGSVTVDHYQVEFADGNLVFSDDTAILWVPFVYAQASGAQVPHSMSVDFTETFAFTALPGYAITGYSIEYRGSYEGTEFVNDEARLRATPGIDEVIRKNGDFVFARHIEGSTLQPIEGTLSAAATLEDGNGMTGEPGSVYAKLDVVRFMPDLVSVAVPEPREYALMLLGLAGVAGAARLRGRV